MKKKFVLAAALAVAGVAQAQTQTAAVTVYGLIDTAVEYITNVASAPGATTGGDVARMPNLAGAMFPSRIGFRGVEDLGGGLNAFFTLENGFGPDTGGLNQGGRLFGRQAFVGLSGNWGTVSLGRNYNMLYQSTFDVDLYGGSLYGLGSLDPFIPNSRTDNSIAYKGTFSGVTVGGTYSFGRDASSAPGATNCGGERAGDFKACKEWSAMVRYDTASWGISTAYDKQYGGPGAVAGAGVSALTSSSQSDARMHVAAYGKIGNLKLGGGAVRRINDAPAPGPIGRTSDILYFGAAYKFTPAFTLDGQLGRLNSRNSGNDSTQLVMRGMYDLSKRTTVYLLAGHIRNNDQANTALSAGLTAIPGASQNSVVAGLKHSF